MFGYVKKTRQIQTLEISELMNMNLLTQTTQSDLIIFFLLIYKQECSRSTTDKVAFLFRRNDCNKQFLIWSYEYLQEIGE